MLNALLLAKGPEPFSLKEFALTTKYPLPTIKTYASRLGITSTTNKSHDRLKEFTNPYIIRLVLSNADVQTWIFSRTAEFPKAYQAILDKYHEEALLDLPPQQSFAEAIEPLVKRAYTYCNPLTQGWITKIAQETGAAESTVRWHASRLRPEPALDVDYINRNIETMGVQRLANKLGTTRARILAAIK